MEAIATAFGSAVAFVGLVWTLADAWRKEKMVARLSVEDKLRRGDVLAWALQAIEVLQTVSLACRLSAGDDPPERLEVRMSDCAFRASILLEQGRLFFRNVPFGDYGMEKPEAYRGLRPKILDQLVVAHSTACEWKNADRAMRARLTVVAEDAERCFVSIIRHEVGRDRTASSGASETGSNISLSYLVSLISDDCLKVRGLISS